MNAKTAREKAKEVNLNRNQGQLSTIMQKINAAVSKGEYETYFGENIRKDVKDYLESEGYTVKDNTDPRDYQTTYRITW